MGRRSRPNGPWAAACARCVGGSEAVMADQNVGAADGVAVLLDSLDTLRSMRKRIREATTFQDVTDRKARSLARRRVTKVLAALHDAEALAEAMAFEVDDLVGCHCNEPRPCGMHEEEGR